MDGNGGWTLFDECHLASGGYLDGYTGGTAEEYMQALEKLVSAGY